MYSTPYTVLASAARTTSGQSGVIDLSFAESAIFFLDVTAVSGTSPTLDAKVQIQDPLGNWYDYASFAQKTAVGREAKAVVPVGANARVSYTIDGTSPSFTFSVTAIAKA